MRSLLALLFMLLATSVRVIEHGRVLNDVG